MLNLLQLFLKLSGFFVFLLLEIICFSLIIRYNSAQGTIYNNSVNLFTGYLQAKTSAASEYFDLKKENKRLARQNALLLEHFSRVGVDTANLIARLQDTVFVDTFVPSYSFIEAKVIKNTINKHHNYLVLNKGRKDGILPHNGVVMENGVVGIVRRVSNHYSVVMSALHRQAKISARIRTKNFFGSLVWKSTDPQKFNLEDIPKHAPIAQGDTVETSGYSAIFPEGIMVGKVAKVHLEPGSNFYTIEVNSNLDLSNIQYVYVVNNIFKREQEALEQAVLKEDE